MKLFIFNGHYVVRAMSKDEAICKLGPILQPGHKWYLKPNATCQAEQGHLVIKQYDFSDDVAEIKG